MIAQLTSIPDELKQLPNWVLWKKLKDIDKKTKQQRQKPDGSPRWKKMPYQINGSCAKSNDPDTWATFQEVQDTFLKNPGKFNGIGFQFSGSGYFGVDFDGIPDEVEKIRSGDFTGPIGVIIDQLGSYAEISQSGTGIHIICRGKLPGADFKTNVAEMYGENRYFALTGDVIPGYDTVEDCTDAIVAVYDKYNTRVKKSPQRPTGVGRQQPEEDPALIDVVDLDELGPELDSPKLTDDEVIDKASGASNGQKFKDLFYNGPGSDHSASDLALMNTLAFYTRKDPEQMDRIFRKSALYRSDKWNTIHDPANGRTYGQMTIDKAIDGTGEIYNPRPRRTGTGGAEDIPYFESGRRYWKEIKKNNGEETAVPISNFVLEPIREVEIIETGQLITECKAVNVHGVAKDVKILPADFNTGIKFNDAIDSKGMRFNGTQTDLQFIKSLLDEHAIPKVLGTQTNGFHALDGGLIYVDAAGIVGSQADDIVTMAESPVKSSLTTEAPITASEMYEILPSLFNFNTITNTTSIIGWTCSTYLKEMFRSQGIKMGHLFISGEAGSGKSETIDSVIRPILGIDTSPINANDQTKYALGVISNASNHIPILIEEYKPGLMRRDKIQIISDLMRNSYDGHLAIRGLPSNRGKTEVLGLTAPLLICGEEATEEKANLERTIFCTFGRSSSKSHLNEFMELRKRKNLLRKLGRALLDKALKMTPEKLMANYYRADTISEMANLQSSRTRNNVAVTICGLYLLNDVIRDLGINFDISDEALRVIENAEYEEADNEAGFTRTDEMINQMSFVCGILPFTINSTVCAPVLIDPTGTMLYLRLQEIYDATNAYMKKNGIEKEGWLPYSQLKKQLKKASYFDDNRKAINTRIGMERKTAKAWTLDISEMERKGMELDGFRNADSTYKKGLPEFAD